MLTRLTRAARPLLAIAITALSLLVVLPASASGPVEPRCAVIDPDTGNWDYSNCGGDNGGEDGEDTGGDDGSGEDDGGGNEPTCDLSQVEDEGPPTAVQWCQGTEACWGNIPSLNPPEDWEDLAGEPSPGEGYIVTFVVCYPSNPGGSWQWIQPPEDQGPSLWDLAWIAFGSIQTPAFELAYAPPTMSYVNLDTWYWAEGPGDGEILGTPAGGVNAIATPDRIEVDPGDGSGVMECPFAVEKSDACFHTYTRASVDHPDGYPARMRLIYSIAFTNNGEPMELDGLPETLDSPWIDGPLPVGEVATIVIE